MPKRELHVMVEDDGGQIMIRYASLVRIGDIDVPVKAGQFDVLSFPQESIEQWNRDVVVTLLEHL